MQYIDAEDFFDTFPEIDKIPYSSWAVTHIEDVRPNIKGKWIRNDNGTYTCSVCQSWIPEEQHHYARYCLYCGADMRQVGG